MEEKMRKLLLMAGLASLFVMIAIPAIADVTVTATVDKDKDIRVIETLTKTKIVDITVDVIDAALDKGAESLALVNQTNENNTACENCAEKQAWIKDSVKNNVGITNVNQAVGNMNNQGNVLSIAVDIGDDGTPPVSTNGTGFAEAQASVDQRVIDNEINSASIIYRDALIEGSVLSNTGITNVNQSSGQMNNQANAISLGISLDGGIALSEADLGQFIGTIDKQSPGSHEDYTAKTSQIVGSIGGNHGVTFVNQTSGNLGNQSNTLSLAASVVGFSLTK